MVFALTLLSLFSTILHWLSYHCKGRQGLYPSTILLLLLFSHCVVCADEESKQKVDNKVSIQIATEVIGSEVISAKEPMLVRVTFTNKDSKPRIFSLGNDSQSYLHFSVYDENGVLVGLAPPKDLEISLHYGSMLEPNKKLSQIRSLSDWYRFDNPGTYSVHAQILGSKPLKVILEDQFKVVVKPYNKQQLEVRCLQLFSHIEPSSKELAQHIVGLDQRHAMQALFSIRDDVALPYFDYLAKEYSSVEACLAIRRVKTKRAEQLIKALAARQDDVGKAARKALQLPIEPKPEQINGVD